MKDRNSEFDRIVIDKDKERTFEKNVKKNFIPQQIIKKESDVWKIFGIFVLLIAVLGFGYLAYDGNFKSNQEVHLTPNNTVQVDNQFDFSPQTDNQYNMTFVPNYTINIYLDSELLNHS